MRLLFFGLLVLGTLPLRSVVADETRPNVILIVADYMGYSDIGPYGSTDIHTPSLDRLAREGTRFTNAYAPVPICSPSRVGLVTGRYPQRAGFEENVGGPGRPVGFPTSETTIARMLQDAGYATAMVGKWPLGLELDYAPTRHGFDEFFGFLDWRFLFDLETDIGERRNLAYQHPDILEELEEALAAWEAELTR